LTALLALALSIPTHLVAQADSASRSWNQPVPPFRIIDSVYYVGASDVTAFLIATSAGHFLLDGGFEQTAPQILANIRRLGYEATDVRFLLNSHAHFDHAGGLAALKQATGAKLLASPADATLLQRGGLGDFAFGNRLPFPPVTPDRLLRDGETLELGGVRLTARFTPGHTKGCTSWSMSAREGGRSHDVLFICSATVPGYRLVANQSFPDIAETYRRTFATLRRLPCDVLLAPHGVFFDLKEKRGRIESGEKSNPYVDPQRCRAHLRAAEAAFESELQRQREQADLTP